MAGKLGQLLTRMHLARSRSPAAASDVPRGHLAVYVGESRKRLVIPTACLNHPAFVTLLKLKRVEDEFGFDHRCGGLTIPCASEGDFAHIVGGTVDELDHHHLSPVIAVSSSRLGRAALMLNLLIEDY